MKNELTSPKIEANKARRQLIIVFAVVLAAGFAALAILLLLGGSHSLPKDNFFLKYNDMVFERIDDEITFLDLELTYPLNTTDCGEELPAHSLKQGSIHRLRLHKSHALIAYIQGSRAWLYRFSYFDDSDTHSGQDILSVCGSETELKSIEYCRLNSDWKTTITDKPSLYRFEQFFGALKPKNKSKDILEQIQQPGAWDSFILLNYKNGLSFRMMVYDELNIITGFRSVFDMPTELVVMLEGK
jgi:hypothetical protein